MTSTARFDNWQNRLGTQAGSIDASGNVTFDNDVTVTGTITSVGNPQGLVLVGTGNFSAVTSADIIGFSSTFKNYRLLLRGKGDSGNLTINAKMYNGGTAISTGYYTAAGYANTAGAAGSWVGKSNDVEWWFGNFANSIMSILSCDIYYTNNIDQVSFTGTMMSGTSPALHFGGSRAATTFDRIRIAAAANMTGTWSLYGYNEG